MSILCSRVPDTISMAMAGLYVPIQCAQLFLVSFCSRASIEKGHYRPLSTVAFRSELVTLITRATDPASYRP
jgi:hypothetical protein